MNEPEDEPASGAKKTFWPIAINLLLLLLVASSSGIDMGALFGFALALFNGLLGFLFLLFERRRDAGYAGGFFLSFLLLLIIGLGMCSRSTGGKPMELEAMPTVK